MNSALMILTFLVALEEVIHIEFYKWIKNKKINVTTKSLFHLFLPVPLLLKFDINDVFTFF